ncbi:hypothetical protein CCMA1212_007372 [Trichoderma ghanense]|uniref:Ketoreductase domain-containing protein n=1 Tax=Trichoderma ghanense TaxID=65468 RepID=A0ABY2GY45_9HYPO
MGAEIYATAGNSGKVQYPMANFGSSHEHIFSSRDASFYAASCVNISQMAVEKPSLQKFNKHYEKGVIQPKPVKLFEATDIVGTFRCISAAGGKEASNCKFTSGSSYLLVDGLSGLNSEQDKRSIKEVEAQGCAVQAIKGSVTSLQDVYRAVEEAEKPITGVFLMTMESGSLQTHEDWFAAVGSKVDSAINLHPALEHCELDFFTLFSSISYAVDQFCHQQGLDAGVANVGVVDDFGFVVENQSLLEQFRALNFCTLGETELLDAHTHTLLHQHPATSSSSESDGFFKPS